MEQRTPNEDKGRLRLYENKYAETEKHPKMTGEGEVPKVLVQEMVKKFKENPNLEVVTVRTAGWERVSRKGTPYTFVSMEVAPEKEADDIPF